MTENHDVDAVLESLESHMGNRDVQVLLRDCRKTASIIRQLRDERDDALSRVDELEDEREDTIKAFESKFWDALRSLLDDCGFDWRDALDGGVTAEEAREHISTTLSEMSDGETRQRRRAMDAEALETFLIGYLKGEFSSLTISFNDEHASNYGNAQGYHDEFGGYKGDSEDRIEWASDAERRKAIAENSVWTIQWYPETQVGFHCVGASTLAAAIRAMKNGEGDG